MKPASNTAFSTSASARWTILSSSDATPSGRSRPSGLGMCTRRTGLARYFPDCTRTCRSRRFACRSCAYSCQLTPSAPGAASFFRSSNAIISRGRLTWCSSAVNRASLSRTATSRTRPSPLDTPGPALRPGRVSLPVFPTAHFLSSPASAAEALFSGLAGTTKRSDCPRRAPQAYRHWRSLGVPPADQADGQQRALPVLAHEGSAHAPALRPRGVPRQLALTLPQVLPSALAHGVGTPIAHISRLNHPACAYPCQRFATPLTGRHA